MDNPIRKISVAKIAGNISDVAVWALEVYKIILSAKAYAVDGVIKTTKAVKSGAGKLSAVKRRDSAPSTENQSANNNKENTSMKKSTFWSLIAFLVAVCAAVAGILYYLKKREAELEEYDDMLFSEDYLADYLPKDEEDCCHDDCCCEEHTAEEDSISF